MANLITEKQKRTIKIDYLIRLVSVMLFIISIFGTFILAYVITYYFALNKKDIKISEQFGQIISVENKENSGTSAVLVVSKTLEEMNAIELLNKVNYSPSAYFNKIADSKNSNIQITKFSLGGAKKNQLQFIVSGISKNREGLVLFIETLKSKAGFASVESPVSDFAKDSNIDFTLNILANI